MPGAKGKGDDAYRVTHVRYNELVIPRKMHPLFWDINVENLDPKAYPVYTIERVLEHGDEEAFRWLLETFTRDQIREVLRTDRRLSPRSANFWALVFGMADSDVAALAN